MLKSSRPSESNTASGISLKSTTETVLRFKQNSLPSNPVKRLSSPHGHDIDLYRVQQPSVESVPQPCRRNNDHLCVLHLGRRRVMVSSSKFDNSASAITQRPLAVDTMRRSSANRRINSLGASPTRQAMDNAMIVAPDDPHACNRRRVATRPGGVPGRSWGARTNVCSCGRPRSTKTHRSSTVSAAKR